MAVRLKIRVRLEFDAVLRKFFTLVVDRDNSFYISMARPAGQPWRQPRRRDVVKEDGVAGIDLDLLNFIEPDFDTQKVSLQRRGFIHSTDKMGKRFKSGIKGPSSEEMTFPTKSPSWRPATPIRFRLRTTTVLSRWHAMLARSSLFSRLSKPPHRRRSGCTHSPSRNSHSVSDCRSDQWCQLIPCAK
jgi:hypothetical protein